MLSKIDYPHKYVWILGLVAAIFGINSFIRNDYSTLYQEFKLTFSTPDQYYQFQNFYNMISSFGLLLSILLILGVGIACDKYNPGVVLLISGVLFVLSMLINLFSIKWISAGLLVTGFISTQMSGQTLVMSVTLLVNQYFHKN